MSKVMEGSRYDDEDKEVEKKFISSFQSEFEGEIKGFFIYPNLIITEPVDVCEIEEACKHEIVYQGICANCGKDVSGEGVLERAPINITHDNSALTISTDEASRLDEDNKKRLLSAKKLSLVVDLDQTIIHAAVDPTIAEWQKDPDNPNYDAVKDVEYFQLLDDGPGMKGCYYYIKQRPGLQEFLKTVSQLYELHIYTMGTRQYAKKVSELIDKDGKYFADRILSRDESGSLTAKSLARLFPVDTKMVVIIDDRADVWDWSYNLVKVRAFDFFQGIGDINSAFLPKKQEIMQTPAPPVLEAPKSELSEVTSNGEHATNGTAVEVIEDEKPIPDPSALEKLIAMGGEDSPQVREAQSNTQEELLSHQIEEKPLEKMQREQDEKDEAEAAASAPQLINGETQASASTESDSDSSDSSESGRLKHRHAILKNDDEELIYLEDSLRKIHTAFFRDYDRKRLQNTGGRVAQLAGGRRAPLPDTDDDTPLELKFVPDVKRLMPAMKERVLAGTTLVFSGVIPLGQNVMGSDLVRWAQSFGATVDERVSHKTTHVIAARPGTAKVNKARKLAHVKIVGTAWLLDSLQQWRKVDESRYYLDGLGRPAAKQSSENGDIVITTAGDLTSGDLGLSSSEEDASGFDTDAERPNKRMRLDTSMPDDFDPSASGYGDQLTPTEDVGWDAAKKELQDFLGSDADTDSETESVASLSYRDKKKKRARDESEEADEKGTLKRSRNSYLNNVAVSSDGASTEQAQAEEEIDSDEELLRELEA